MHVKADVNANRMHCYQNDIGLSNHTWRCLAWTDLIQGPTSQSRFASWLSLVNIWSVDKSCSYLIYIFRSNRYLQNPDERYLITPWRKACVHVFILLLQSINKYIPETKKLCFFFLVSKPTLSLCSVKHRSLRAVSYIWALIFT